MKLALNRRCNSPQKLFILSCIASVSEFRCDVDDRVHVLRVVLDNMVELCSLFSTEVVRILNIFVLSILLVLTRLLSLHSTTKISAETVPEHYTCSVLVFLFFQSKDMTAAPQAEITTTSAPDGPFEPLETPKPIVVSPTPPAPVSPAPNTGGIDPNISEKMQQAAEESHPAPEQATGAPLSQPSKIAFDEPPPPKTRQDFLGPFLTIQRKNSSAASEASTRASSAIDADASEPEKERSPLEDGEVEVEDSDSDDDSDDEAEEPETHWGWTVAKYCGMGLLTLAILFDEME
ncbi:unnamed protein product [Amoebophrya sp. A25]|nr:unnamed protein product [Amoebophrya sp. A25]|eukprot:GSA25T00014708001.1